MEFTLEQARRLNKVSRQKAAEAAKVSTSTIDRWEKGKSAPDIVQLRALCNLYGLTIDDIFVCKQN